MSAASQNQSCLACAQSKRKCDKQRPVCRRCRERDEDCIYQQRKKHCRRKRTQAGHSAEEQIDVGSQLTPIFSKVWPPLSVSDTALDPTLVAWSVPPSPLIDFSFETQSSDIDTIIQFNVPPPQSLWFTQDDSWTLHQSDDLASCQATTDLEAIFDIVRSMLIHWTETGSNGFIHSRLYEYGMPTCLQDAFLILAAYTSATSTMRTTLLQIADERAQRLVQQRPETGEERLGGVKAHLSRLHALFVMSFIRLFDGSVRFRASAEKQLPILRTWMNDLKIVAAGYRGDYAWDDHVMTLGATSIWHSWIVIESVRRTLLVVQAVANVYRCMTVGHAACDGAVMITARRGMFDADTSAKWLDICSKVEEPLLVPPLRPTSWMLEHSGADVDDFVLKFWSYIVEPDRLKCWVDQGRPGARNMQDLGTGST